jgi:uncharacterized protein (PEP-CTERM system associated)
MATVMDTMRNKFSKTFAANHLIQLSAILFALPAMAEINFNPYLNLSSVGYQVKTGEQGWDKGFAQTFAPSLQLSYSGPWLRSSLQINHQSILYEDAQRDNYSYTDFRLSNSAEFLKDALSVSLSANQSYRAQNEVGVNYVDSITTQDDLTKVSSEQFSLNYRFDRFDWALTDISFSMTDSKSDRTIDTFDPDDINVLLDSNVKTMSGGIEFQSADRNRNFFWGLRADGTKTSRRNGDDFYNRRGQVIIGVPFFWRVQMVGVGSFENNSQLVGASNLFSGVQNFRSIGAGLEWKITDRSWWNLTLNKVNDEQGAGEYFGTQFSFQPSRRTKLSGSFDRRFFGRTAQIDGSYKVKSLSMKISVSDTVASLLGLNSDEAEFALFICPPGVQPGLANCFQPPTVQYRPQLGETAYNIQLSNDELSEQIVIRRSINYDIGYQFSRLKLQFRLGQRKDRYLERDAMSEDRYINLSANWTLSGRDSLTFSSNVSKLDFESDGLSGIAIGGRKGDQLSNSVAYNRKINSTLTANVSYKRIDIDFEGQELDFKENRVFLDMNFRF